MHETPFIKHISICQCEVEHTIATCLTDAVVLAEYTRCSASIVPLNQEQCAEMLADVQARMSLLYCLAGLSVS